MNESTITPLPASSSPRLFVQEATGLTSNQHFNLASWHHQSTVGLSSFVCTHGFRSIYRSLSPLTWMKLFQFIQLLLYSLHLFLFFGALLKQMCVFRSLQRVPCKATPLWLDPFITVVSPAVWTVGFFPGTGLFPPIFQGHVCQRKMSLLRWCIEVFDTGIPSFSDNGRNVSCDGFWSRPWEHFFEPLCRCKVNRAYPLLWSSVSNLHTGIVLYCLPLRRSIGAGYGMEWHTRKYLNVLFILHLVRGIAPSLPTVVPSMHVFTYTFFAVKKYFQPLVYAAVVSDFGEYSIPLIAWQV